MHLLSPSVYPILPCYSCKLLPRLCSLRPSTLSWAVPSSLRPTCDPSSFGNETTTLAGWITLTLGSPRISRGTWAQMTTTLTPSSTNISLDPCNILYVATSPWVCGRLDWKRILKGRGVQRVDGLHYKNFSKNSLDTVI